MSSSCKTYLLSPSQEGVQDTFPPPTTTVRNKCMREAPASLNSSLVTLLCKSEITAGTATIELGSLQGKSRVGDGVIVVGT